MQRSVKVQLLLGVLMAVCVPQLSAQARNGGTAAACDGCHTGGQPTQPVIAPANPNPQPGSTQTVTVTIPAVNGGPGGMYLKANAGSWALLNGQGTKTLSGGIVHTTPRAQQGGQVTFQVQWTAPSSPGGVDFEVWALSANGNNSTLGDGAGYDHRSIAFGCAGTTYYRDFDGDGYGSVQSGTTVNCTKPFGYSEQAGDCNDNDHRDHPGATELCDGRDNDCDGETDEGLTFQTFYEDKDGDGYGVAHGETREACGAPPGFASQVGDCADDDNTRHPGADEVCNSLDDDCDGQVDEGARVTCGEGWCRRYGPSCNPNHCMPGIPEPETCNYLDDDCDGQIDEGDLCGSGRACVEGACVDAPSGGDGGGGEPELPAPEPSDGRKRGSSCAQASGSSPLLWLVVLAASLTVVGRWRTPGGSGKLWLAALLGLTGCSSGYKSESLGVSWQPPSFAKLVAEEAEPHPTARFSPGITLRRVPEDAPGAGNREALLAAVAAASGLSLPEKIRSHRSGTLPAGKVERLELEDAQARTLLYVVRGDGHWLALTLTAPHREYTRLENGLERSLASLRIR